MKLKRWVGIISIAFGCVVGVMGLTVDGSVSYVGDEMSISDGLMVYRKVNNRSGAGFVGIGMTDPPQYLLPSTPNLGIVGSMRTHGSFSSGEVSGEVFGTTSAIDWRKGNNQQIQIGAGVTTFAFTAPQGTAVLTLKIRYNDGSTFGDFTWGASPATVKWTLGEKPIMSGSLTGTDRSDTVFFFYDANRRVYYGVRSYGNK